MPTTLREFIQQTAKENGWPDGVDQRLENLIWVVASRWADRRVAVAEEMRQGTYKPE